jgi:hypothetical protein
MTGRQTLSKFRRFACATAVAFFAVLAWSPRSSDAAWDGTHNVHLGDTISAEFVGAPLSEEHTYSFYAMANTTMNTTVTVDSESVGLVPEVKLFDGAETQIDLGATQVGNKIKNFKFTTSGPYYLRVRATAGTGTYKLATKGKFASPINGSTTTGAFTFDAGADTFIDAAVKKSKGGTAQPVFTGLTYNGGVVDIGTAANTTKIKKLVMPVDATYTLAINPGTAGQSVDVKVTLTAPRPKTWSFGHIEETDGLATENRNKWLTSAHADHTAEAFNHWNNDNPPQIPTSCARCHSTPGYRDYLGADGSAPNVVDNPAPIGTVVECDACHNDQALALTSVTFPSGLTVSGLGKEARCMVCHQGRESTVSVDAAIDASTKSYKVTTDEAAGTGVLGVNVAIAAGATFTDAGAGFDAAGVGSDGTYYLQLVANPALLNGVNGAVSTKNIYRVPIVGATADALTLAAPLGAETPPAGKSFQYAVYQLKSDDTISPQLFAPLGFKNVHYYAAGASLYGREAAGAYEYEQPAGAAQDVVLTTMTQRRGYDRKFTHVAQKDTCIECHDPHTQKVKVDECAACHVNSFGNPVASYADLHDIRMAGTVNDFNGNGNVKEGVWYEIKGLQDTLYAAMQSYATLVCGSPIEYRGDQNPYFFIAGTNTKYANWTARLMRAGYNYQYSVKDPGAFAHNGKFIVEFLYDSIADLNSTLSTLDPPAPVANFDKLERNDPGHFDSDAEPYRHWDEDSDHLVDPSCSRCHSIEGFQFVVKYGIEQTIPANLISGLSCETCHVQGTSFAPESFNPNPDKKPERVYVASVQFPFPATATSTQISNVTINNGAKGTTAQDDSFICMTCHRARESKLTLDAADPSGATTNFTLSFKNSHYLGAGATMYGSKAAVMYQYPGKTYVQRWDHDQSYLQPYPAPASAKAQCKFCHMQDGSHSFQPDISSTCTYCHINATSVDDITPAFRAEDNYDNNPATKPKAELGVFQARLLTAIQNYCTNAKNLGVPGAVQVAYDPNTYPYFVKDNNGNGVADPGETTAPKFDTKTFRATFNYNFSVKEPGCWAHNPKYVLQILYDAIQDLGGSTAGLTRPQ